MARQRLLLTKRIKPLGLWDYTIVLKIYEPYAQARQDRNSPNSRYSAKAWHSKELWAPRATYENLTAQEAFVDLPTAILEYWGYKRHDYIMDKSQLSPVSWSRIESGVWGGLYEASDHPWIARKERKNSVSA